MGSDGDITANSACWACGTGVMPEDNYCRKCGQGLGRHVHWYYGHAGAVFLTIAAGPLALYFVWRSPVLSRAAKWVYTAAIAAVTWYAVDAVLGFWAIVRDASAGLQF